MKSSNIFEIRPGYSATNKIISCWRLKKDLIWVLGKLNAGETCSINKSIIRSRRVPGPESHPIPEIVGSIAGQCSNILYN
jgi:hypothetical protein